MTFQSYLNFKERIKKDVLAADIQWSFFVAACSSYKHDSLLRPFPPMFQLHSDSGKHNIDTEKDIQSLVIIY